MSKNGNIDQLLEDLDRLYWLAITRVEETTAAMKAAAEELEKLEVLMKAAGLVQDKPKANSKPKVASVSKETYDKVKHSMDYAVYLTPAHPDVPGSFTIKSIAEQTNLHPTTVRAAFGVMSENHEIRSVGKVPNVPRMAPEAFVLVAQDAARENATA